jgi:hypothetical protein
MQAVYLLLLARRTAAADMRVPIPVEFHMQQEGWQYVVWA